MQSSSIHEANMRENHIVGTKNEKNSKSLAKLMIKSVQKNS